MLLATRACAPPSLSLLGPAGSDRSLLAMAQRIATAQVERQSVVMPAVWMIAPQRLSSAAVKSPNAFGPR